jgi:hypothetical protein
MNIEEIISKKNLDPNKLRLSIGSGDERYSNCINLELPSNNGDSGVDADIFGDITKGIPEIASEAFYEVLLIHVIEHLPRRSHQFVFDEIWRLLKPNGRLIISYPEFIEIAKRFIENRYGARWSIYDMTIYGANRRNGDAHVTAIEKGDLIEKLFNSGFKDIKYTLNEINSTIIAYKGVKLDGYI